MKKFNIAFFTGNRAEYGMIKPFIKYFESDKKYKVHLIVSGSHLDKKLGGTIKEIYKDKIKNIHKIFIKSQTNTLFQISNYSHILQNKINSFVKKKNINVFFLSSDRFETLSVAITAHLNKIPIIHFEGGDKTEGGTLDDITRHAITKLSHLHLTSNKESFNRVIRLGEEKWRIINVGYAPFLSLNYKELINEKKLIDTFNLDINKRIILFTMHPLPLDITSTKKEIKETIKALKMLDQSKFQIIATYPNFDPGYNLIINELNKLKIKENFILIPSLGNKYYHSLLNYMGKKNNGICMGNSSSGIKETIFFGCNTLNIGKRQNNRSRPNNILDVKKISSKNIYLSILKTFNMKNKKRINPYSIEKSLKYISAKIFLFLKDKKIIFKKCTY